MKKTIHLGDGDGRAARDVQREIDHHLDLRASEFEAQGMSPDDARRAALAAFGDRRAIEAEVTGLRTTTMRERGTRDWRAALWHDVIVAIRGFRRTPTFTIVALLTLTLGIGANTAIFSVLQSVLLRPLPYPDANQLVQLWSDHRQRGREQPEWLAPPDFDEWRTQNRTFSGMAAYRGWSPDLTGAGEPMSLRGYAVSGNMLEMLGAKAVTGRLLTMNDDQEGAEPVVVISSALWERQFGGDAEVVGRLLSLNGEPWRVVGVLDRAFRTPLPAEPEVYRALRRPLNDRCGRGCIVLRAIGRLKPGVTHAQGAQDLQQIATRQGRDFPETNANVGAWLIPLREQLTGETRPALLMLAGAVGFVLLIACVNLANLLLVRGGERARELGVRAALGAGRGRIVRQLLVESTLLAIVGGALGIALATTASGAIVALVPADVRQVQFIGMDRGVVAFAVLLTLLSGILFGVLPALHAARTDLMVALRSGARELGGRGRAMRGALVVSQLALAVVLLVASGLLGRSFLAMQRVDYGFRTDGVLLSPVYFPPSRYAEPDRAVVALEDVLQRLRQSPAIRSAEAADVTPLSGSGDQDVTIIAVGEPRREGGRDAIWYRSVSPGYLQLMGVRLVEGRYFTDADRDGAASVAIVNAEAARFYWRGKSPVGREIATSDDPTATRVTIVGVVANARHNGPGEPVKEELFLPIGQVPARGVDVVMEAEGGADGATAILREALREVDPLVPVAPVASMRERAGEAVALPRVYATLLAVFAGAALLLAMVGTYGVMAYTVSQRQREIGVRLALGASPSGIRRLVLGEGGRLAASGVVLGIVLSVGVGRLLRNLLFGVSSLDVPTLAAVPLLLAAMVLLASWLPARRAMRMDPLVAMRDE